MIAGIAVPALVALMFKLALLGYSLRSPTKSATSRLFLALLATLALHNLFEVLGLNHFVAHGLVPMTEAYGFAYIALLIPAIALLLHVSLRLSIDLTPDDIRVKAQPLLYVPAAVLVCLLLFTDKVVLGFQPFQNTVLRVAGPWYYLFETYAVVYLSLALLALCFGARPSRQSAIRRTRNHWWLLAVAPTLLLLIYVIVANHLGVAKISSTIYIPIALTFFLVVTTYATHQHRLFDIQLYIPWSRTRANKRALYRRIHDAVAVLRGPATIDETAVTLASRTLHCPVVVALEGSAPGIIRAADAPTTMDEFPRDVLATIDRLLVAAEIEEVMPERYEIMKRFGVAAIAPLLGYTDARGWILLGEPFGDEIHSSQDFHHAQALFRAMAEHFQRIEQRLGHIAETLETVQKSGQREPDSAVTSSGDEPADDRRADTGPVVSKSLEEQLNEHESRLIAEALHRAAGSVSGAARLLGVRPNTLYYKMKRHGISAAPAARKSDTAETT